MDDFRPYVNPQPGKKPVFTADWQRVDMPEGDGVEVYVENKSGTMFDALLQSLRRGSIVAVRRLLCLAPWSGTPTERKKALGWRIGQITKAGGVVLEIETGHRSDEPGMEAEMVADGSIQIQHSGRRAGGGKGKPGRPGIELTPEERERAEAVWRSREYGNDDARLDAIEAKIGRRLKKRWCHTHFGSPHARAAGKPEKK